MGMKLKSGADLCGFQLTNFCVQGEASAPSDAALGRKYFHTNATDDVATGISLLNRERIYLGEGAWRATAYLDDIAAINEKLNLITGDTDTDTLINNLKDLEEFLKDFSETDKLKSLLDGKLDKSGGTISISSYGGFAIRNTANALSVIRYRGNVDDTNTILGYLGFEGVNNPIFMTTSGNITTLIHSGNCTSYNAGGLAHSNGTVGAVVNSSGNVTIGDSDLAGTSAKLYVDGNTKISSNSTIDFDGILSIYNPSMTSGMTQSITLGYNTAGKNYAWLGFYFDGLGSSKNAVRLGISGGTNVLTVNGYGNVLIGNTTDSGYKLDVNGAVRAKGLRATSLAIECDEQGSYGSNNGEINRFGGGNIYIQNRVPNSSINFGTSDGSVISNFGGDVHIMGNLIVDGEVSAGGAGAEGGTSGSGGSVDFHSEDFTPSTSTTYQVNHNLGKKVIVQVYEQGATSETWNLVMVDVEIISATRLDLRFGKTETTPHRVVVMGAGV